MRKNKKVKNATAVNKGKNKFRSKLELYTYNELKKAKLEFKYEEDRFEIVPAATFEGTSFEKKVEKKKVVIKYVTGAVRKITYLPDFTNLEQGWIIEVKGLRTQSFDIRWKLFKKHLADNGLTYDLYMPGNQAQVKECVSIIKNKIENDDSKKR